MAGNENFCSLPQFSKFMPEKEIKFTSQEIDQVNREDTFKFDLYL